MPVVTITTRTGRSPEEKKALMDAVHQSLRDAFRIPEGDRSQRLLELSPEEFDIHSGRTGRFVLVEIDAFAGRSADAKRALYKSLGDRLEALGMPRTDCMVLIREHPMENWGIRGGQAACDVDLGFKVDV
ncbi:tautomerase family protein [Salidesulfovibrio onnuriiensis]|uniref:tautomerase family protein n=1 Tax=Salidesulfovibrio onnuriiensis TaxID=2583823 RepID=UPI0011C72CEF|nr:tautomerase family protein [Salidesulfovibrio onnuriiensis]